MTTFAERLKNLRKQNKLTQLELSKITGISASMIGMYEQGARKSSIENLELLSDFFNVDIDYILGRTNIVSRHLGTEKLDPSHFERTTPSIFADANNYKTFSFISKQPKTLVYFKSLNNLSRDERNEIIKQVHEYVDFLVMKKNSK